MGYEIAAGHWRQAGGSIAGRFRHGGDGSYLMMNSEIATSSRFGFENNHHSSG